MAMSDKFFGGEDLWDSKKITYQCTLYLINYGVWRERISPLHNNAIKLLLNMTKKGLKNQTNSSPPKIHTHSIVARLWCVYLFVCLFLWDRVSLCSSGWLELAMWTRLASAFQAERHTLLIPALRGLRQKNHQKSDDRVGDRLSSRSIWAISDWK